MHFTYVPVDISPSAIRQVTGRLRKTTSDLGVEGRSGEYLHALDSLRNQKKVILFLGSSIGNFSQDETIKFFSDIAARTNKDDVILTGFDLKKDPEVILAAYNDKRGITAQFNLNLLRRINRELGANFDLHSFEHFPSYHEKEGEARSALISLRKQEVKITDLDMQIQLEKGSKYIQRFQEILILKRYKFRRSLWI